MIIRSAKQLGSTKQTRSNSNWRGRILPAESFRFEILKEISRSNRREKLREFALILLTNVTSSQAQIVIDDLASKLDQRIRISDSLGWLGQQLCILLPETDKEGASILANELLQLSADQKPLETEIHIYPWDDQLISSSHELSQFLAEESEPNQSARVENRNPPFTRCQSTPLWKRMFDFVASFIGLVLLSPLFLIIAIAIKLNSRGPVFFRQMREGKGGQIFGMVKFRTMIVDAEGQQDELRNRNEQDGPAFKLENDPRVTWVGRYLRKSCADELPQLVNVLCGQMSLVGPRPLPSDESFSCHPWHRTRLTVLPGLTCIWQVRSEREVTFDQWMRMDLDYIRHQSIWLDMKLLAKTVMLALMHRGSV